MLASDTGHPRKVRVTGHGLLIPQYSSPPKVVLNSCKKTNVDTYRTHKLPLSDFGRRPSFTKSGGGETFAGKHLELAEEPGQRHLPEARPTAPEAEGAASRPASWETLTGGEG